MERLHGSDIAMSSQIQRYLCLHQHKLTQPRVASGALDAVSHGQSDVTTMASVG
jgi:hypothetical protein